MPVIRIATRTSKLALVQAEYVKSKLLELDSSLTIELVGIKTQGDKILDKSLAKIGGKGLFIKELEDALLSNQADIAVHSMKDVPFVCVDGLEIAAICEREDPRDALVSKDNLALKDLKPNAVIGTSSLRRMMQVNRMRPDLQCVPLRGNVPTRLQKCQNGEFDAIILAAAGLKRLDLHQHITEYFEPKDCLPAVGQGAVGIEVRKTNQELINLLKQLNHLETQICVLAERAMNKTLQGSCSVPLAGFATLNGEQINMTGRIGWPDGSKILEASLTGSKSNPYALGQSIAQALVEQGAQEILDASQ